MALAWVRGARPAALSDYIYDALGGFAAVIPANVLPNLCADSRLIELGEDHYGTLFAQKAPFGLRRIGGSTDGLHAA
jgi:hypothetical protein